jgi:hypothetical protein
MIRIEFPTPNKVGRVTLCAPLSIGGQNGVEDRYPNQDFSDEPDVSQN